MNNREVLIVALAPLRRRASSSKPSATESRRVVRLEASVQHDETHVG